MIILLALVPPPHPMLTGELHFQANGMEEYRHKKNKEQCLPGLETEMVGTETVALNDLAAPN